MCSFSDIQNQKNIWENIMQILSLSETAAIFSL